MKSATENNKKVSDTDVDLVQNSGLSPALKKTIMAKIERGELDEVDHDIFEQNLQKIVKKDE